MKPSVLCCFLLLLALHGASMAMHDYREEEEEWEWEWDWDSKHHKPFLLKDVMHVIKTDAGYMKVVRNSFSRATEKPMHIGFITMEPKSLFVPQYVDSGLVLFIKRGEAKLGVIHKDELSERRMKPGDIFRIEAGSAFYIVNTAEGQRLHVICSIDPSESLHTASFQVSVEELRMATSSQRLGPITFIDDSIAPKKKSKWSKVLETNSMILSDVSEEEEMFSWRKLFGYFMKKGEKKRDAGGKADDSYNIYDKKKDFSNDYGWSVAVDGNDYKPLKHAGMGVYLVNLTAGSMMAPHWNPRAAEYGVVLGGSGRVEIVYPNGTEKFSEEVSEGDVFWVPRYFPFCQIASRTAPFEFFGFTTSARRNRPQFLAGANSVLHTLMGRELASGFGVPQEDLRAFIDAQREAVILPSAEVAPPGETRVDAAQNF